MGFGRPNLACRQDLQGVGARQLGPFAAVRLPDVGGMRGLHTPETSNASFWIGRRGWRAKGAALRRPAAFSISTLPKYFPCVGVHADDRRTRVVAVRAHHAPEALQRRTSLVLVTRRQVQPVSLQ